ncbi:hypothetical protein ZIOFF_076030 [Zingiber officinale]|uniref:ethanolamine-phosphate cytidylyltransferase n=1 Tax=Zingiber officinale TaxID=94328 RepID=A0A8J5BSB8_ZINOF|nr:hypothetical protein ZIOFF_076030 [Zingiber officinale]
MGFGACAVEVLGYPSFAVGCLVGCLFLALSFLSVRLQSLVLGVRLPGIRRRRKRPVRVYMDGCFDMMHYGHCNALRQARALGDQLVVGVVSDDEIKVNKGPPVTPLHERMIMVGAVKWVDEVIHDAPYAITEEFMNKLFTEYQIDYIIHGDDPCLLPDGTDAYALAKKAGRYKQIKRTEGVSSTDIVGRMLLCVRERSLVGSNHSSLQRQFSHGHNSKVDVAGSATGTRISHFLPTSRRIVQFSNDKGPGPNARIIYIDGAFDLFHAGHVEILRLARELGDFLLVGIHTDQTVSIYPDKRHGLALIITFLVVLSLKVQLEDALCEVCSYPSLCILVGIMMNIQFLNLEIMLSLSGSENWLMNMKITTFNISLVVHGTIAENIDFLKEDSNPYAVPMAMGIYKQLKSPLDITTSTIIKRIVSNHEAYQACSNYF